MIILTMLPTSLQMHTEHGSDEAIIKISVQDAYVDLLRSRKNLNGLTVVHWCHDHVSCGSSFLLSACCMHHHAFVLAHIETHWSHYNVHVRPISLVHANVWDQSPNYEVILVVKGCCLVVYIYYSHDLDCLETGAVIITHQQS